MRPKAPLRLIVARRSRQLRNAETGDKWFKWGKVQRFEELECGHFFEVSRWKNGFRRRCKDCLPE